MKTGALPVEIASTERWLVVEKPAGWLSVRPTSEEQRDPVLADWLQEKHGKLWIVHRLDIQTSGVMLFARTAKDHREASIWFHSHQVRKYYDCIAAGEPPAPMMRIREAVQGKAATTQVEVLERFGPPAFLARAFPRTGRRHQIRQHLAHQGCPILGDREYDGPGELALRAGPLPITRVALHAARLELPSGEAFDAAWPDDFAGWVQRLRKERASS